MRRIPLQPGFEAWRHAVRECLRLGVRRESTPYEAELDELEPVWRMHYAAHSLQPAALQEA